MDQFIEREIGRQYALSWTSESSTASRISPLGRENKKGTHLTIQRRFYKEADKSGLTTLQEVNEFFWAWLEQCYHQAKHKGIGMPPLERWQMEEHLMERLSLETLEQKMQRRTYRGVDFKTALIRLNGKRYQASQNLAGEKRLQVRWPFDDESAETSGAMEYLWNAWSACCGTDIDYSKRPVKKADEEPKVLDCSKQLRLSMVARHRRREDACGYEKNHLFPRTRLCRGKLPGANAERIDRALQMSVQALITA